jgi:hypothetical protein
MSELSFTSLDRTYFTCGIKKNHAITTTQYSGAESYCTTCGEPQSYTFRLSSLSQRYGQCCHLLVHVHTCYSELLLSSGDVTRLECRSATQKWAWAIDIHTVVPSTQSGLLQPRPESRETPCRTHFLVAARPDRPSRPHTHPP